MDKIVSSLQHHYQKILGQPHLTNAQPEEILEHILSYYQDIISCMPGNVYWLDKNGVTLGCNQNVLNMFGLKTITEFQGLSFEDMGHVGHWSKEAEQKFKEDTLEVVKTGKAKLNLEEPPIPHANGHLIYFLTSRVPLFDYAGQVVGVVGISIDITERKNMELSLLQAKEVAEIANQAKTIFLENMRHDIRTPLSGIVGFSQLIRDEARDSKVKDYAENLLASSIGLLELLNEILEAIKVTSGDIPKEHTKFNVIERIESILRLNKAKAQSLGLALNLQIADSVPHYIVSDPNRLHRIVLELVTNSLKFTEAGFINIAVACLQKDEQHCTLQLTVSDSGMGIAPEKQQEIFSYFSKLNPSYQGVFKGAGLGLAIVKQFVEDLHGEIVVHSEEQQGTTFTVTFTAEIAATQDQVGCEKTEESYLLSEKPVHIPDHQHPAHILIVEDDGIAGEVARLMLTHLGCTVDIADSGAKTLQLIKQQRYDLVFMDIGLPDTDGYQLTQAIRAGKNTIPIIALTAHVGYENRQRCIEVGMNAVFSKPLMQEKAYDLLCAFLPWHKRFIPVERLLDEDATEQAAEKVIDFDMAKRLIGSEEEMVKHFIKNFIVNLQKEQERLSEAFSKKDWETLNAVAHKIKGSAAYCGALQLRSACEEIEEAIKHHNTSIHTIYANLLAAIDKLQKMDM